MSVRDRFEVITVYPETGGTAYAITLPRQQRSYRLVCLACILGTDATVGDRYPTLQHEIALGSGTSLVLGVWGIGGPITAGQSCRLTWSTAERVDIDAAAREFANGQIPSDLIVEPGQTLVLGLDGSSGVGDVFSVICAQVKWLERQDKAS